MSKISRLLKALDLDHTLAEGHTSLAYVRHHFDWDWAGAEEEYKESIQLDPSNAITHLRYAEFLSNQGRHDQAIREVRQAHELAPRSLVVQSNIGRLLYYARRYDEGITELKSILADDPKRVYARIYLALCYEQKQMYPEALAEFQRVTAAFNGQEGVRFVLVYGGIGEATMLVEFSRFRSNRLRMEFRIGSISREFTRSWATRTARSFGSNEHMRTAISS